MKVSSSAGREALATSKAAKKAKGKRAAPDDSTAQGKRKEAPGEMMVVAKRVCHGMPVSDPPVAAGPPATVASAPAPPVVPVRIPGPQPREVAREVSPGRGGKQVAPAPSGSQPSSGRAAPRPGHEPSTAPSGSSAGGSSPRLPSGRMSMSRRQEGDLHVLQLKVGARDSALRSGTVAREVAKMMFLPRDLEERERLSVGDIVNGAFPHLVEVAHDLAGMQAALVRYIDMNTNLQAGLKEAKEQLAGSDRRLKEMFSAEAKAKAELIRLHKENEELRKENGELRKENQSTRATLTARETRLVELMGLAAGSQSKLDHTIKLLEDAEGKKKTAEIWATAAEGRASAAEEQALALQGELATTRGNLSAAGEELAKAVEVAAQAVPVYKESKEFEADAALACVDMYKFGYADCLAKVQEAHPALDLNQLALDAEDEEEEGEEGEIRGGRTEVAPEADPEGNQHVPEESVPAILPPATGVPEADSSGAGGGLKEDGPPPEASKNGDSGYNASEPIIVESPEPGQDHELPAKEL